MTVAEKKPTLRAQLKRAWGRVRGGELTPRRAFWSVAIGLFVGVQPTPGLHLPVVLAVCVPLRLDAPVSYLAANISIPPVAPFLWLAALQIGSYVLHGRFVPLTSEGARALAHAPGPWLGALALGSGILGATLGALGGGLAYVLSVWSASARGAAQTHSAFDAAVARTAKRFERAAGRRSAYYYVRGKLRGDPCSRAIATLGSLGDVLDVGCGRGQLALLLLEIGAATRVRGWDWDERKTDLARRAGEGLDAHFTRADIRLVEESCADTVLLIDVLHYFRNAEQDALLVRAARLVRPGGRLIVREASTGQGWRSFATLVAERVGTAVRFNRGERVVFRDVARELGPILEANGMTCTAEPCWRGTPFSNVLLVATRAPASRGG